MPGKTEKLTQEKLDLMVMGILGGHEKVLDKLMQAAQAKRGKGEAKTE